MLRLLWIGLVLLLADFIMNLVQAALAILLNIDYSYTVPVAIAGYVLAGAYTARALRGSWLVGLIGGIIYSMFDGTLGVWMTEMMMTGRPNYPYLGGIDPYSAVFSTLMLGSILGALGGWLVVRARPRSNDRPPTRKS